MSLLGESYLKKTKLQSLVRNDAGKVYDDEFYTAPEAAWELVNFAEEEIQDLWKKKIHCPCDSEESEIYKLLVAKGYKVTRACIEEGADFLRTSPPEGTEVIITNPPFSCHIGPILKAFAPYDIVLIWAAIAFKNPYEYLWRMCTSGWRMRFAKHTDFTRPDGTIKGVITVNAYIRAKEVQSKFNLLNKFNLF